MITYTLVIIMSLYPNSSKATSEISSTVIPGFYTEQACVNAAKIIKLPENPNNYTIQDNVIACIPMKIQE